MVGNSPMLVPLFLMTINCYGLSCKRFFRDVSRDPIPNWTQISVVLQSYGSPKQIYWYERPMLKTLRQWWAGQGWLYKENNIKEYLARWDITAPITYTTHHLSHAAYAYYTQPYDNCAVICLDSIGEF